MTDKKIFNFGMIGLSFIFIFNPNVNVIDVLPDFIGYIILCIALTALGDINDTIAEALVSFKRMIFIDAAKLLALLWVFGISVTSEYNSSLMLWSFVFGVLEMVILIPAYIKLFKGFTELGYFHSNTSIIGTKGYSRKNYTDKIRTFTVIFIILKATMSFLPELSDLTSTEYYENQGMTNLYQYIGIMRFLAFVPVLLIGIIWLVKISIYFRRITQDSAFCSSLTALYEEKVYPKKGIFIKRNIALSFLVLITALVFSFDFRIENINILPDFICAVLIIVFFCIAKKKTPINNLALIFSGIYVAVSIVSAYFEFLFFDKFYYEAIYRDTQALNAFRIMAVFSILSTLLFAFVCSLIIKTLKEMILKHTGNAVTENQANSEAQNKMLRATHNELSRQLVFCIVATALYAIADICYVLLAPSFGFMLLINTVCAVIFVVSFVKAYFDIYEAVNSKYILE